MSTLAISSPTLTQRYFDAWNDHDDKALVACFAAGGTFSNPAAGDGLAGEAIAAYARDLWVAFPDLRFEVISANACGVSQIAVQWVMRGTNLGPYHGHAPTARAIALAGADFIRVSPEGIRSILGYFDGGIVRCQLGIGPGSAAALGPFSFGVATRLQSGHRIRPGALTVTTLRAGNGTSAETVREAGFEICQDLLGRPGFVSLMTAAVGEELMTIAAWDSVEAAGQQRDPRHGDVIAQFFPPQSSSGGMTVWAPVASNTVWIRCTDCGAMSEAKARIDSCHCGARLPEGRAAW